MGNLARSYAHHFTRAYADICVDFDHTKRLWVGSPKVWTDLMLGKDNGVLTTAARGWVGENFRGQTPQFFFERRKVDLMVGLGSTDDLWATAPVLLVEHENAHDIEVEVWNLASWRVPLRVLVFYSDETDQPGKFARIEGVLRRIDEVSAANGEFLFLSAPWRFDRGLKWGAWNWRDGAIAPVETFNP